MFSSVQCMICIFLTMSYIFHFPNWIISWKCFSCFNKLFQTEVYWGILKSEEASTDNLKSWLLVSDFTSFLLNLYLNFFWMWRWTFLIFIWFCGKALVFYILKIHRSLIWYKVSILLRKKHLVVYVSSVYLSSYRKFLIDFTKSMYAWCLKLIKVLCFWKDKLYILLYFLLCGISQVGISKVGHLIYFYSLKSLRIEFSLYSKRGGGWMCAVAVENCISYKKGKKHKYLEWIASPLW